MKRLGFFDKPNGEKAVHELRVTLDNLRRFYEETAKRRCVELSGLDERVKQLVTDKKYPESIKLIRQCVVKQHNIQFSEKLVAAIDYLLLMDLTNRIVTKDDLKLSSACGILFWYSQYSHAGPTSFLARATALLQHFMHSTLKSELKATPRDFFPAMYDLLAIPATDDECMHYFKCLFNLQSPTTPNKDSLEDMVSPLLDCIDCNYEEEKLAEVNHLQFTEEASVLYAKNRNLKTKPESSLDRMPGVCEENVPEYLPKLDSSFQTLYDPYTTMGQSIFEEGNKGLAERNQPGHAASQIRGTPNNLQGNLNNQQLQQQQQQFANYQHSPNREENMRNPQTQMTSNLPNSNYQSNANRVSEFKGQDILSKKYEFQFLPPDIQ